MSARIIAIVIVSILLIILAPWFGFLAFSALDSFVFWQLRVPRVLNGLLVGATLSIAGASFQSLFGNPLATPSTTGTTAGASLGALVAIVLLPASLSYQNLVITSSAFIGAIAFSFPLAILAAKARIRMEHVLLAGIGCTLATGAISTGLQFQADMSATYRAVQWSLGSLSQMGYQTTYWLLPICSLSILGLLSQRRGLEALVSGEEQAWAQGVPIIRVRTMTLIFASFGVAGAVSFCGPIAFVGLLVPHLLRLSVGKERRWIILLSPIFGGAFLIICDVLARSILASGEIPVGVITSALGAPMLVGLILFQNRME